MSALEAEAQVQHQRTVEVEAELARALEQVKRHEKSVVAAARTHKQSEERRARELEAVVSEWSAKHRSEKKARDVSEERVRVLERTHKELVAESEEANKRWEERRLELEAAMNECTEQLRLTRTTLQQTREELDRVTVRLSSSEEQHTREVQKVMAERKAEAERYRSATAESQKKNKELQHTVDTLRMQLDALEVKHREAVRAVEVAKAVTSASPSPSPVPGADGEQHTATAVGSTKALDESKLEAAERELARSKQLCEAAHRENIELAKQVAVLQIQIGSLRDTGTCVCGRYVRLCV